jgi:hypothetical protein
MGRDAQNFELATRRRVAKLSGDSEVLLFPASPCNVLIGRETAIVNGGTSLLRIS